MTKDFNRPAACANIARLERDTTLTMTLALIIIGTALYLSAALLLLRRLATGITAHDKHRRIALSCAGLATIFHAVTLYQAMYSSEGINLSFFHALSLTSWLGAALILLSALRQPVENLGIAVFPFSSGAMLLQGLQPAHGPILTAVPAGLEAHVLLSVFSYSLLSLAALQAILLAIQTRHLRNRTPGGFIRALPPLETMEGLLFSMIGVGYLFLSLSLVSGIPYLQDIVGQHLVHKTVLSVSAWVVFALLLWGRWRFGWRGRTAIRWTLSGFGVLMLAYFGSKLVLELILQR